MSSCKLFYFGVYGCVWTPTSVGQQTPVGTTEWDPEDTPWLPKEDLKDKKEHCFATYLKGQCGSYSERFERHWWEQCFWVVAPLVFGGTHGTPAYLSRGSDTRNMSQQTAVGDLAGKVQKHAFPCSKTPPIHPEPLTGVCHIASSRPIQKNLMYFE